MPRCAALDIDNSYVVPYSGAKRQPRLLIRFDSIRFDSNPHSFLWVLGRRCTFLCLVHCSLDEIRRFLRVTPFTRSVGEVSHKKHRMWILGVLDFEFGGLTFSLLLFRYWRCRLSLPLSFSSTSCVGKAKEKAKSSLLPRAERHWARSAGDNIAFILACLNGASVLFFAPKINDDSPRRHCSYLDLVATRTFGRCYMCRLGPSRYDLLQRASA